MGELHGIQNGANGGPIYNCCSYGKINLLSNLGSSPRTAVISVAARTTKTNCYYLNGIQAKTPESGTIVFEKTSEDENVMTTTKVVEALNGYIRLKGVINEGDAEVDTTGWCKWVENEDHLPVLDFNYEWDPTAGTDGTGDFVRVTN